MGEDRADQQDADRANDRAAPEHPPERPTIHVRRRLTVSEAADELGISAEAVRSRVKRGTLRSTKEGGTVYVLLPGPVPDDRTRPGDDQAAVGRDQAGNQAPPEHDRTADRAGDRDELIEELRDRVRSLEEANRENRRIIAALTSRIPAIDSGETPGDRRSASEGEAGTETPDEEAGQPRASWWRRWLGFE